MLFGMERFFDVFDRQATYLGEIPTDAQMSFVLPLTAEEVKLLRLRFNRDGTYKDSLKSIGKDYGVTSGCISGRIEKALRKLRQPSSGEDLKSFIQEEEIPLGGMGVLTESERKKHLLDAKVQSFTERLSKLRSILVRAEKRSYDFHRDLINTTQEYNDLAAELLSIRTCIARLDERNKELVRDDSYIYLHDISVDKYKFRTTLANGLRGDNIRSVAELVCRTEKQILELPNIGIRYLREIQDALKQDGLCLGMKIEDKK